MGSVADAFDHSFVASSVSPQGYLKARLSFSDHRAAFSHCASVGRSAFAQAAYAMASPQDTSAMG
jgi:hypothetical protein